MHKRFSVGLLALAAVATLRCGTDRDTANEPVVAEMAMGTTRVGFKKSELAACRFNLNGTITSIGRGPGTGTSTDNRIELKSSAGHRVLVVIPSFEYSDSRTAGVVIEQGRAVDQVSFSLGTGATYATTFLPKDPASAGKCLVSMQPSAFQVTCNDVQGTDGTKASMTVNGKCN